MGFRLFRDDRETRILGGDAYLMLERTHSLPDGLRIAVEVEFFPEARGWNPDVKPLLSRGLKAARRADGRLQLPERVVLFSPSAPSPHDAVVRIAIEGEEVFLDKVERNESMHVGVETDPAGTRYIDALG